MTGGNTTSLALVLTAAPGQSALDAGTAGKASRALAGARSMASRWLVPGEAWEAQLEAPPGWDRAHALGDVVAALRALPVDVNLVAGAPRERRKRLLVADMDSTVIGQECIDEMADLLGLKPRIAAITERAMKGELPFEAALTERVAMLKGLPARDLERVYRERITLMPGARALTRTMSAHGAYCALVSGGFTFFTSRVRAAAGFDADHANTLLFEGDALAGTVALPILGREAKLATLERYTRELGLKASQTLAVGDGANDLAMIKAAGLGVAYRAKPIVAAEAAARVTHGDLTALLYLQGYHRDEIIAPM